MSNNIKILLLINDIFKFIDKAIELELGYLSFGRVIPTLSGGELQRLRLVQLFICQLSNLIIILDEPLAGLFREERKLVYKNIVNLIGKHTVIVVDHGKEFIDISNKIITLGEGGGNNGGRIIDTDKYLLSLNTDVLIEPSKCKNFFSIKMDYDIFDYKGIKLEIALNSLNLIQVLIM